MKHFTIAEWTDYVRGLAGGEATGRMKAHLDKGCQPCANTVHTLKKLVAVIAADTSQDVPSYVIHNAKSLFALQQPEKVTLSSLVAQLVYDSFRQPQTAGVRSQQPSSRHAVYQAGDFCVNLRLDRENGGGKVNLVGQVGHRSAPAAAIANVRVSLMAGQQVVAQALSNEFGEFHFEYVPTQHLRLHMPVDTKGKSIEVRLNELSVGESLHDPQKDE